LRRPSPSTAIIGCTAGAWSRSSRFRVVRGSRICYTRLQADGNGRNLRVAVIDLSKYVLETVRSDDAVQLLRGRHRSIGASAPSILLVRPVSERPTPATLERLEHEHSLARDLDSAWAVRPISLTRLQERTALVLEDPGGQPLDRLLGKPLELGQFLRVAVSLSGALAQLHARGLVHKDIKPANVVVDTETGSVRLMGFGIASRLPREHQPPVPPEFIAGTLPYMAPEQTGRMNRSIDSRSDLYAAGVFHPDSANYNTISARDLPSMIWLQT